MKLNRKIALYGSVGILLVVAAAIIVPTVLNYRQKPIFDDPIIIWSDKDFKLYDFIGNGTESDPYIIENLKLTTTAENGIYIRRTTNWHVTES